MKNTDVEIVCRLAKCSKEEAHKTLELANGDIARALLILQTR